MVMVHPNVEVLPCMLWFNAFGQLSKGVSVIGQVLSCKRLQCSWLLLTVSFQEDAGCSTGTA